MKPDAEMYSTELNVSTQKFWADSQYFSKAGLEGYPFGNPGSRENA
jgi:hypothetical protein